MSKIAILAGGGLFSAVVTGACISGIYQTPTSTLMSHKNDHSDEESETHSDLQQDENLHQLHQDAPSILPDSQALNKPPIPPAPQPTAEEQEQIKQFKDLNVQLAKLQLHKKELEANLAIVRSEYEIARQKKINAFEDYEAKIEISKATRKCNSNPSVCQSPYSPENPATLEQKAAASAQVKSARDTWNQIKQQNVGIEQKESDATWWVFKTNNDIRNLEQKISDIKIPEKWIKLAEENTAKEIANLFFDIFPLQNQNTRSSSLT